MEENIKEIIEAPAKVLDETVHSATEALEFAEDKSRIKKLKEYSQTIGPGVITGSSGNDPSGIATYSQTGAHFGYGQLWMALLSFPMQASIQEMCARIGMVTGHGLTSVVKSNYAKPVLYLSVLLLAVANIITLGADIGAMADSTKLLIPEVPFAASLIVFILITLILQIYLEYKTYANYLKYLTFFFIAYIFTGIMINQDWNKIIWYTFVPYLQLNQAFLVNVVAVLGTTITPYMYFWQSNQAVEEEIKLGLSSVERRGTTKRALKLMRVDIIFGMFFSNAVMWFIIITAAATLGKNGILNIQTAAQAALALKPFAGNAAFALFAIGIIGAGLLAVPILAGSAAYAISELLGWKQGLYLKPKQAYSFYGLIIILVLAGSLINFIGVNPIKLLYYAAVINGVIAAPLVFLIVRICNNKQIMNGRTNGILANSLGYFTSAFMGIAALLLLLSLTGILKLG